MVLGRALKIMKSSFNLYCKSAKALAVIYADLKFLLKRVVGAKNNHKKSARTKVDEHILFRFSISMTSKFTNI